MESVGTQLREARLRLGFTLEEIRAKTRISLKNLQAIEDDNLNRISSPFFYKSFVRQFAEKVQLDYATLAGAVHQAASTMPEPLMPGQVAPGQLDAAQPMKVSGFRPKRTLNLRWLYSVSAFAVMLVACSSVYGLWQESRSNWRASLAAAVNFLTPPSHTAQAETLPQPAAQPFAAASKTSKKHASVPVQSDTNAARSEDEDSGSGASVNASETDTAARETIAADAAFRVELSAIERTWLSIVADGKETFTGILEAADTKVLEGHDTARIRTGNAGGLALTFNGKSIGTLGPRGQIRTVVFTKDNYEVLEPPARMAMTHFIQNVE